MKFVLIDTNLWIYLAEEPQSAEYLDKLGEIFCYPDFSLVIPESTKVEFERHGERITCSWKQRLKSQSATSYQIFKKLLPNRAKEIESIYSEAQASIEKSFEQIESNLSIIRSIFENAEYASVETYMSEASRRCLYHVPPAHKTSRSSPGDCLLWLTTLTYLDKGEVWFCTNDSKDFSSQDKSQLDEDLKREADAKKFSINYFNELSSLIETALPYRPKLPKLTPYGVCLTCGSSNLFQFTRTVYGAWIDCLKCRDCGSEVVLDIVNDMD